MSSTVKVEHNIKNLYFFIRMGNKSKLVLEYKKLPNSIIEMYHTEISPEHRGQGFAKKLTKEGFKYCLDNNYRVLPTCSYVAKYCRDFATNEEKKIVVENA